jgi:hypothetical protein
LSVSPLFAGAFDTDSRRRAGDDKDVTSPVGSLE